MPDLPIVIPDTAVAPKDYTLSGTQELALKTVRALIDGSGAATAFLPTLQLLDPNGHVMWEGATTSTVAAGGSADVSWFPGLGLQGSASSASTPGLVEYAWATTTGYTWTNGVTNTFSFSGAFSGSSDSSVISVNGTNDGLTIQKDGLYFVNGLAAWAPGAAGTAGIGLGGINIFQLNTSNQISVIPTTAPTRTPGLGGGTSYLQAWGFAVEILGGGTDQILLTGLQTSGANVPNVQAGLFACRLGVFS